MVMRTKDECGIQIEDQKMIVDKFISHYTHRFKSAHDTSRVLLELGLPKLLPEINNQDLIKLLNVEEVKSSLFSIDSNKTLGSTGFGADFFLNYQHINKKDHFNYVIKFFTNGKMLKEINHMPSYHLSPKLLTLCRQTNIDPLVCALLFTKSFLRY